MQINNRVRGYGLKHIIPFFIGGGLALLFGGDPVSAILTTAAIVLGHIMGWVDRAEYIEFKTNKP